AAVPPPEVPECPPARELAMKLMRLGPGTFLMGSPHGGAADERPAHYVTLSPFCLGAYEVTRAQWRQVMGEAAGQGSSRGDELPVEDVSWDDVKVFLARLNGLAGRPRYRLPTEAEWEYAARAGSSGAYSFGDDPGELYRFGNCKSLEHDDGFDRTAPVGSFLPNRWGLYDLYGNLSEWVEDAYGPYAADPVHDPHVLEGPLRVRRGGSWAIVPKNCRSAFRNKSRPDTRKNDVGFRLVRLLD
ncbi:MAG TPA: formylglycine-generating enzyme family protein, partial [Thermoanaerobaculia bacterium]|nr:formylglycine-generating enzyme family protein [Thermoanaerobaculia bacterium]